MPVLSFSATVDESELLDTSEALAGIVERAAELDLPSSLVDLLLALDEAITVTVIFNARTTNGQPHANRIGHR